MSLLHDGKRAYDELIEALQNLTECIKSAEQPLIDQEYDPAAIRGELIDMQKHLTDAKSRAATLWRIMLQLAAIVRRMQVDNHQAQLKVVYAFQKGKSQMLEMLLNEMTDDMLDELYALVDQVTKDSVTDGPD